MRILKPYGPYRIPCEKGKKTKKVTTACAGRFWAKHPKLKRRNGCYIFGIRAAKSIKPTYVGKATKSFGKEIFTVDKLHKYQVCLADHSFGTPIVFLVALPKAKGPTKASLIAKVERELIAVAKRRNKKLMNKQNAKGPSWCISGVIRPPAGKPPTAGIELRHCLGLGVV